MEAIMTLGADGIVTAALGSFSQVNSWYMDFAVNVHASLLPKHVVAPHHCALIQGDEETGVTIMEMVKEMDGDMISCRSIPITDEIMSALCLKISHYGRDAFLTHCRLILLGIFSLKLRIQVTFSPNIRPWKRKTDWPRPIVTLIRWM